MEIHRITINTDGDVSIAVSGVKGKTCQDSTRTVEQALGRTVEDKLTPEAFQSENQKVKH